jgi:hypothetical protein
VRTNVWQAVFCLLQEQKALLNLLSVLLKLHLGLLVVSPLQIDLGSLMVQEQHAAGATGSRSNR